MPCLNKSITYLMPMPAVKWHQLTFPNFVLKYKTHQNSMAMDHKDAFSLMSRDDCAANSGFVGWLCCTSVTFLLGPAAGQGTFFSWWWRKCKRASSNTRDLLMPRLATGTLSVLSTCHWPNPNHTVGKHTLPQWSHGKNWMPGGVKNWD